mmetsp:Transcript_676/g.1519  ORF Transcript_676/g.1519 Transcript_676/m.1519 type:complete len:290 (+) Transcript_676:746-1615(+)
MQRQLHQRDMRHIGQDVPEHARPLARADGLGRAHVLAHAVLHELGPDEAVDAGPAGQRQHQGHGQHLAAGAADGGVEPVQIHVLGHRGEREQQHDVGNGGEDVVDPLQQVANLAAEKARQRAEHGADQRGHERSEQADGDRHLGALEHLGQHVATEPVAAQRQGLGPRDLVGLEGLGALGPFGIARRQRVDVGEVDIGALGLHDDAGVLGRLGAQQRRRRIGHAQLLLPARGHPVGRSQQHQHQEGTDHRHGHQADTVGLEPLPGRGPDAAGGCACAAHLSTTRGSTKV